MVALHPDRQRARLGFRSGAGRPHRTSLAVLFGNADVDHVLTSDIRVGLPLPTLLALWAGRGVALPVDGEGTIIKTSALPCLPAGIGGHGTHDSHPIFPFASHEDCRIGVAAV